MTLLDLIRKPVSRNAATAIPAIPATATLQAAERIARIATVAIANPVDVKPANRTTAPAVQPQPPPALQAAVTDPADLIFGYAERMAICSEAGDVTEDAAHRIATEQGGATLDELAARQVAYWHQQIATLPDPTDYRLAGIKDACLEALAQRWVLAAAALGWTDRELFGLDPAAPTAYGGNGIVVSLAFSPHRRPVRVVEIDAMRVVIETGTGSRLQQFRDPGRCGPPIWDHPAFRRLH